MKKIELLSPVGDFECLKAAVQNGADSVYFGASNFNARASATNFDLTNLKEAICYAKLRGVNTHLTLNTLIKDSEFEDAVLLAKKAYEFGIDAIIVQDLGLARYLIKNFPKLPIHASTQMTIHNLEGVLEAEKLGFKRAVLSRELSLEEIEYICNNSDIEIETFIHGALCISYSGQCLFSSMVGGRSGNRGKCAQPCRLPYQLIAKDAILENYNNQSNTSYDNDKTINVAKLKNINDAKGTDDALGNVPNASGYLLSTRDLCGLSYLPQLIKAGVMCFKIEGRMKTPEYVATVTRIYRKYIDLALSDKTYKIDSKDVEYLAQIFNRGNFSCGHLDSKANKDLVYPEKQNHMGIYIGNISNFKPNKGHVFVNLTDTLSVGDTVQFEKESTKYTVSELMIKNKNITTAKAKQFVEIGRMKGNLNIGDKIYRVNSKELSTLAKASYQEENKKILLDASIKLRKNEPITLTISTYKNKNSNTLFENISVSLSSEEVPVEAKSRPLDEERIISQLNKTNDTIFSFNNINVDLEDNLFLPSIKVLNELRRNALEEIFFTAQGRILRKSPILADISYSKNAKENNSKKEISVLLNILNINEDYSKLNNIDKIYIPLKYFSNKKYENIINDICSNFNTYIYLPTIIKSNYKNLLNTVIENSIDTFHIKGFVVSNLSNGIFIKEMKEKYDNRFEFIGNYTLNIYNNETEKELKKLGIKKLTISPELNAQTIENILENKSTSHELIVYGRTPLMSINYCLLGKTNKCYPTCGVHCMDNKEYYLKDRLGFNFRILPDNIQTVSTIYNSKITSIDGSNFNVDSYRIDILDENVEEINSIIDTVLSGNRLEGKEYTNGNLNREI